MKKIEKILKDVKENKVSLNIAKHQLIEYILEKPSCHNKEHEIKYLQSQDAWYCIDCRDMIGYTKDIFKGYRL